MHECVKNLEGVATQVYISSVSVCFHIWRFSDSWNTARKINYKTLTWRRVINVTVADRNSSFLLNSAGGSNCHFTTYKTARNSWHTHLSTSQINSLFSTSHDSYTETSGPTIFDHLIVPPLPNCKQSYVWPQTNTASILVSLIILYSSTSCCFSLRFYINIVEAMSTDMRSTSRTGINRLIKLAPDMQNIIIMHPQHAKITHSYFFCR